MASDKDNIEPKVDPRTELFVRLVVGHELRPIRDFMGKLDEKIDVLVQANIAREAREGERAKIEATQVTNSNLSWKKLSAIIALVGLAGAAGSHLAHALGW